LIVTVRAGLSETESGRSRRSRPRGGRWPTSANCATSDSIRRGRWCRSGSPCPPPPRYWFRLSPERDARCSLIDLATYGRRAFPSSSRSSATSTVDYAKRLATTGLIVRGDDADWA
jgi:hypothetical protein